MKEQYIRKDTGLYLYPEVPRPFVHWQQSTCTFAPNKGEEEAYNQWRSSRIEMSEELLAVTKEGDVLTEGKEFIITGGQRKRNHDGTTTRTEKIAILIQQKNVTDDLAKAIQKSGCKVTFGIQPHHIKRIEEENNGEVDFRFSEWFWEKLAKEFYWHPFTLALYYFNHLLQSDKNVQVSDTTEDHSSNAADPIKSMFQKITCNGCREMTEERFVQAVEELNHFPGVEAFKEELEKQYPLQGMKPNRFRQQGANWSFTNYTQPLLSELAAAKKEIERLKSQLDTVKKQWGIFK